jgi:TetR/AcrR family transcriptional regulator
MKMQRGRKRTENPETARRILAAAEQIFATEGLAGARTDAIARAAGVNKAMLYYYFRSKQQLHRAVFENLFTQASLLIQAKTPPRASPRQAIIAFVDGYFDFRLAYPNYARLMQQVMVQSPRQAQWLARKYFRPGHRQLSRLIKGAIARGQFQAIDPDHAVLAILAMIVFYFSGAPVHSVLLRKNALEPSAVQAHKRAVLKLLEHGLFRSSARPR